MRNDLLDSLMSMDQFNSIKPEDKLYFKIKEEINMEEKLNKYLEENNIEVDENGNFEMYLVVDADDKDNEVGTVYHGKTREVYAEGRVYEDLEQNKPAIIFTEFYFNIPSNKEIKKKTSIREELLTMKDKMFKVLVNKENVVKVQNNILYVNKYRVIKHIELNPVLKFKIKYFTDEGVAVLLYNSLTKKYKQINLVADNTIEDLEDVRKLINDYLARDEKEVALINSIIDEGAEL
jgi:hypothetical protein